MFLRLLVLVVLFLNCLVQSIAAPARPVSEYPAAHALRGEVPAALAVDTYGYSYLAGVSATPVAGHAAGALYVTKIDPTGENRLFTAYLGGSGFQRVTGVAVDAWGNTYLTGYTSSADFPVIGGVQKMPGGGLDAFVAKLDPKGATWLYSTYLGGSGDDRANGIAVDQQGNAYITGRTASANFPLKNAAQANRSEDSDGFLAEIGADGATLLYATYLGGGTRSSGNSIAVDSTGAAFIAGSIGADGARRAFFLKTATDGPAPEYLRMMGGDGARDATSIAVDAQGAVYVAGWSEENGHAVFAAKFTPDGERLYSTAIAGTEGETAPAIAADSLGNAYVSSARAGVLVKLSATGRQLSAETLPASGAQGAGLAVEGSGRAVVAGAGVVGQAYAARVSTCSFQVSHSTQAIPAEGGAASVAVETAPECDWQATADAPWVALGASSAASGVLSYRATPNRGPARSAVITLGGETVIVTQPAGAPALSTSPIRLNPGFRASFLNGCDDCSSPQIADLGFAIDFYGRSYTQAWVNANGNLTFDAPNSSYMPEPLANLKSALIAPFWADADSRNAPAGAIAYGRDVVEGHAAFGVTWTAVGSYATRQDKHNTFQLVLVDRSDLGPGYFDIEMNYADLEWDAGEASPRASARAGFTNGTGLMGTWLELPGSGERGTLLDGGQDSLIGRHTFSVRPAGAAVSPSLSTAAPAPASTAAAASTVAVSTPATAKLVPLTLPAGTITEYPVPITSSQPYAIAPGPDGALWFADWSGFIGRITTGGAFTSVPDAASQPHSIVAGPDGNLWFTDTANSKIGMITTAGIITEYATTTTASGPHTIAVGSDGALWFTESTVGKIGRITTAGAITEFALSHSYDEPEGIAAGSDGALWFTEFSASANNIGRITTAGAITEFAIPTASSEPFGIAAGADGALWFTEYNGNKIGRITTGGGISETTLSTAGSEPYDIVAGPDQALWFTQFGTSQIGRITTSGTVTENTVPTANSEPAGIAVGSDGAIWFTEYLKGKIGRLVTSVTNPPSLSIAKSHIGSFTPNQQGATYTVTVSNAAGAGMTSGTVTVTEAVPAGLMLVSMAGGGWSCPSGGATCTRSDGLAGGGVYSSITVTVNVAYSATSPQVNAVFVSGGGSASSSATDPTVIANAVSVGTITEYTVPITSTQPYAIAAGPDGALWFTDWSGFIDRISTGGVVTETPDLATNPRGIVAGPDGALWFTDSGNAKIGRITTTGAITEFATPTTGSDPYKIIVGPDGALWFTEEAVGKIGRITTGGAITEFALSHSYDDPVGITMGPDDALWFTEYSASANNIGRITTAGVITEYSIPTGSAEPFGIVTGPDGALWFTEYNGNKIGRMTTTGSFTEYVLPSSGSEPSNIVVGPDGALWFTEFGNNQIGRITTAGLIAQYTVPTANSEPADIAVGSDGALWFTEFLKGKIGRIVAGNTDPPVLSITKSHAGNFTALQQGATYTVTVSNAAAAGPTSGTVTVTEMVPDGLTLVSMAGTGWTCPTGGATCTRTDPLSGGGSYAAITVTVNVVANATSPQVNAVSVSGGGSASASATDSTIIGSGQTVGVITEYPVPISSSQPYAIATGPDGALWFTDWAGYIGRITTSGAVNEAPDSATNPRGIVTGPDGALWFTDSGNAKIGRITTTGAITEFATPTTGSDPYKIIVGPDGALWFTEYGVGKIGRITTGGAITEFALSHSYDGPVGITVGPDGALWFTEYSASANNIGRITAAGVITEYAIPTNSAEPFGIVTGPDGALWFTEYNANKIGRMTTAGVFTEYVLPSSGSEPSNIVVGPDGALWFTHFGSDQIGRITTAGLITEYTIPTANSEPADLTVGPDGAIWFTEFLKAKIGRIVPAFTDPPNLSITESSAGTVTPGQPGATETVTVANATAAGVTSGTVTVTETVSSGLTLVSMAGTGWTCPAGGNTCTTSNPLAGGSSYPAITVTFNVSASAGSPQVSEVNVSGGGSANAYATNVITVSTVAVGTITQYPSLTSGSQPIRIVSGPDGALWYTEYNGNKIGRITTAGAITEFTVPTASSEPYGIANGPDGALWFTEFGTGKIGRLTTAGGFNEYAIPTASSQPVDIVAGPDGALWFTEFGTGKIGRATVGGVISEFALAHPYYDPRGITVGPDGALWFAEYSASANQIGRITTSGAITEYPLPTNSAEPYGIVTGPDGALWFTEFNANQIGRITTAGVFNEYALATAGSEPAEIVVGPDGALWFTQFGSDQVGRITTAGLVSEYPVPTANSEPLGIAVGSNNSIWFTEYLGNKIGQFATGYTIAPAWLIAKSHSGNFLAGQQGATYTVAVSNVGAAATASTVTVTETIPAGLTLVSMAGSNWNCPTGGTTCTRSDALAAGAIYPPITVTVNVSLIATSPQVNTVSVSGGGAATASASDPTIVINAACSIVLTPTNVSVPPTGTSTVEVCPNNSGQPNCGVYPETPQSFTVTPTSGCGPWTAASSVPEFLQVLSGASGTGPGTVTYAQLTNTHNGQQNNTITITSGASSAVFTVAEAGNPDNETYRQIYALYEQLLGRDPDSGGFAFWSGIGGASLGQMADDFLTSPEAFNTDFAVMAAYQAATGAPPLYAQYTVAAAAIRAGEQTVPGLFNSLIGSGFTSTALYHNLLNRAPGTADGGCVSSGLTQCFQTIVGYPANTTPVSAPNNEFQSTGIYQTTLAADHTNSLYMTMVYFVTVNRDPDPGGFAFWLGIANMGGPGLLFQGSAGYFYRDQILGPGTPNQGFIGSPEFQGLFAN